MNVLTASCRRIAPPQRRQNVAPLATVPSNRGSPPCHQNSATGCASTPNSDHKWKQHACRERRRGRLVSEAVEGHGLAHGEREHHAQQARRDHPNVPATMGMLQLCRLPDEHRIHHQPRQWAACAHPHSCRRGGSSETDRREDALPEPLVERAVEQLVRRVGAHERVPTPRLPVEKAEGAPRTNCLEPLAPGRRQIEPDDRVVRIDLPPMVGIPEGATRADDRARAVGHPRPALSAVDHASAILKEASSQRDTPAFGQCLMVDSP
eukprot:CAMPEP_0119363026 /NCGR_PEP_ID=MMETSP1334-20130426/9905_1 /TAXON_ID=127549 /ORGANISM="Calcidiscus leptoporus, Strain RCC1130" /LENGTH=264 /DNA_ID=CAMNT_0007378331 /DNA_START=50 /DNA_END=845 /DNA_ORIENTATION=+